MAIDTTRPPSGPDRTFHVKHSRPWTRLRLLVVLMLIALTTEACTVSQNPISGNRRAYGYTWAQERQLGAESDQQITAQFGLVDNPDLAAYVDRIGQEVLAQSHLRAPDAEAEFRNTPFVFRVLDSPIVNAFALPGGYVYVTRGLLTHLNNEAQLAVVLGHEITHVAGRHASRRAAEQQFSQIGLLGGAVLGGVLTGSGNVTQGILDLGGSGLQLMLLQNSRDDERESDYHGVSYAAKAGYAAGEGSAFFESLDRLQEQSSGGIPSWLSSHPEPYEREQRILEIAEEWRRELNTPMTRVNTEQYMDRVEGMVMGENPRQGYVQNSRFYHPDLRFSFPVPSGFSVDNQQLQVVMAEPNGAAALVFTSAQSVTGQQVSSPQQAAQILSSQEGIQTLESGAASSNGLPAYFAVLQGTSGGQTVRILAYFVQHNSNVWAFLGYSTADGFSQYQNTFLQTMRGYGPLTESRFLNVQPARINVTAAPRRAAFQSFLPATMPAGLTPRELAIINQVELDEVVEQGRLLKLPTQ